MSAGFPPTIEQQPHVGAIDRMRNKWTTLVATGAAIMAGVVAPAFEEQPAYADTGQVVVGMPFEGKWAYNTPTTAGCGPGSSQTSHPSCHENYVGDWAIDLYGAAGTDVKLKASSSEPLTFAWEAASGTCGETRRVKVYATGTYIGRIHFTHLSNAASTGTAPTNDMTIGKIANLSCNPGGTGKHAHLEFDNASANTHSCYTNYSNADNTAGMTVGEGASLGVLGSTNTTVKEACASLPSGGGTPPPGTPGIDTIGVYNPNIGTFDLRNTNTSGNHDVTLAYGNLGIIPLKGDWDGDGDDTIGVYNPNLATFDLRNTNTTGSHDITLAYGNVGAIPLVGDWDGDGDDTIGVYNPNIATFDLRNSNTSGNHDITLAYGNVGAKPVVGDWDGDGDDTIGVYNPNIGTFDLRNTNTTGSHDITLAYGNLGIKPMVGDWNGS